MSCREAAAASVLFDADRSQVIIVDLTDVVAGIPVCRTHVATRNAPIGWTLHDRRTFTQQRLIDEPARSDRRTPMIYSGRSATFAPTVTGPSARPKLRRPAATITSGFPWDDDPTDPTDPIEPTDPGGAAARPSDVDPDDSPLLHRAFRQS